MPRGPLRVFPEFLYAQIDKCTCGFLFPAFFYMKNTVVYTLFMTLSFY